MKHNFAFSALLIFLFTYNIQAQNNILQAGPMLGYSEMREVPIWVQTNTEAKVKIKYWDINEPSKKYYTREISTLNNDFYTAKLIADSVEPGKQYNYELYINNEKEEFPYPLEFETLKLWQWREDPPNFSFATGSCAYINEKQYDRPGKPYGSDYEIFKAIYEKKPDFMLWLGDNVYLREPDWNTRTGILKRYSHTRSNPELQPLLASVHHYAIWDDHDFGPNNSDRSFPYKNLTREAFKLFWANPFYGLNGEGITTKFDWADVEFFLLDDRTFRSPNDRKTGERVLFGDMQIQWLIDALVNSKASFKIIASGGQILNPVAGFETYATYPEEKAKLLNMIKEENISGVIFLSGDRHHSEAMKLEREGTYPLYEFTVSPFTAGPHSGGENENNFLRIPGTLVSQRNFAIINVSGSAKERELKCSVYNTDGTLVWTQVIKANDLK